MALDQYDALKLSFLSFGQVLYPTICLSRNNNLVKSHILCRDTKHNIFIYLRAKSKVNISFLIIDDSCYYVRIQPFV